MGSGPIDELVVVALELERGGHRLVGEGPVAVFVVEIARAVLQVNADRFGWCLADECLVIMATADVGETADMAQDLAEVVRAFPGNGEGTDASGTDAADRVQFGSSEIL